MPEALGYILLAVVAVLLGLAAWRILRRRSASCCGDRKTGGKVFRAGTK